MLDLLPVNGLRCYEDPYEKIYYWARHTDWGSWPITAPQGYKHPKGYRLEYPANCFQTQFA